MIQFIIGLIAGFVIGFIPFLISFIGYKNKKRKKKRNCLSEIDILEGVY